MLQLHSASAQTGCASAQPPAGLPLLLLLGALRRACQPVLTLLPHAAAALLPLRIKKHNDHKKHKSTQVKPASEEHAHTSVLVSCLPSSAFQTATLLGCSVAQHSHPGQSGPSCTMCVSDQVVKLYLFVRASLLPPLCVRWLALMPVAGSPTAAVPWTAKRPPLQLFAHESAPSCAPPATHVMDDSQCTTRMPCRLLVQATAVVKKPATDVHAASWPLWQPFSSNHWCVHCVRYTKPEHTPDTCGRPAVGSLHC